MASQGQQQPIKYFIPRSMSQYQFQTPLPLDVEQLNQVSAIKPKQQDVSYLQKRNNSSQKLDTTQNTVRNSKPQSCQKPKDQSSVQKKTFQIIYNQQQNINYTEKSRIFYSNKDTQEKQNSDKKKDNDEIPLQIKMYIAKALDENKNSILEELRNQSNGNQEKQGNMNNYVNYLGNQFGNLEKNLNKLLKKQLLYQDSMKNRPNLVHPRSFKLMDL